MGRWICIAAVALGLSRGAAAATVTVSDAQELATAIGDAAPGDVIIIAAGATINATAAINCDNAGTQAEPITLRGTALGDGVIKSDTVELFRVQAPYWVFEDLDIEGVCADHSQCEHAFHLSGDADNVVFRGNRLYGFNAHFKSNQGGPGSFPDDVLIEANELFNPTARQTANPVTPIDVVGGRRWNIRANFIHDAAKDGGNGISYQAFLKGNSRDGTFERNLIVCELLHSGQARIGLSFGGGGTSPESVCEGGTCTPEHSGGIMRNNIIANCGDVGVYINNGTNVRVHNNTIFATSGIDVRFAASSAELSNNLLMGPIRERDGGSATSSSNLDQTSMAEFTSWFADPAALDFSLVDGASLVDQGVSLSDVGDDYCGNARDDGSHDIGAIEYESAAPCDTSRTHPDDGAGPGGDSDAGSGSNSDGGTDPGDPDPDSGCGCQSHETGAGALLVVLAMAVIARRREQ